MFSSLPSACENFFNLQNWIAHMLHNVFGIFVISIILFFKLQKIYTKIVTPYSDEYSIQVVHSDVVQFDL